MRNYSLSIKISGITCDACVRLIKRKVGKLTGVTDVIIKNNNGDTTIVSNKELEASDVRTVLSGLPYTVSGVNS